MAGNARFNVILKSPLVLTAWNAVMAMGMKMTTSKARKATTKGMALSNSTSMRSRCDDSGAKCISKPFFKMTTVRKPSTQKIIADPDLPTVPIRMPFCQRRWYRTKLTSLDTDLLGNL